VEYRKATVADIEALVELRKQQLLDEGLPALQSIDNELRSYFHAGLLNQTFVAWLALEGDTIVATSGLCFYQLPPTYSDPSGRVAYVTSMFTLKPYRRKGIASALLDKILGEARSLGFSTVRLHSSTDGRALYAKFGFVDSEGYMALKF